MRAFSARRVSRTVVVGFAVLLTQAFADAHAASPFTVSITEPVSVVGLDVALSGTADSPAGEASGNYVVVEWGDGTSTQLPNFVGTGPWSWGPTQHTYAAAGSKTIIARMLHASPNGKDASKSTDEVTIAPTTPVVEDEPPVIEDEPPVIEDEPPVIEDEPPVIEDEPPVIEDEPPVIEDEPPIVEDEPPVIEDEPPIVEDEPPVIEDEPPVIEDEPPVIEDETSAEIDTPAEDEEDPIEYEIPGDENTQLDGTPEADTPDPSPAAGIRPAVLGAALTLGATGSSTRPQIFLGIALMLIGIPTRLIARPKR